MAGLGLEKAIRRAYISPNLGIEQSIRKANRTPPEILATPNTEEIAYRYMEDKGDRALSDKKFASDIALKEKMQAETVRQADIKNRFSNEELAIWKSQNNLATLLGAGATVVAGLGGLAALKKSEARDITQQKILATQEESKRIQQEGLTAAGIRQDEMYKRLFESFYNNRGGVGIVDNPWER